MKIIIFGCLASSMSRICMQAAHVCSVTFFLTSQNTKKCFFQTLNSPVVGKGPSLLLFPKRQLSFGIGCCFVWLQQCPGPQPGCQSNLYILKDEA